MQLGRLCGEVDRRVVLEDEGIQEGAQGGHLANVHLKEVQGKVQKQTSASSHSTTQHNTAQHNTTQHNTTQDFTHECIRTVCTGHTYVRTYAMH